MVGLFDIGDEILPSYIGIIIGHYNDPYYFTNHLKKMR